MGDLASKSLSVGPSKSSPQQQTSFHAPQCLPPFPVVTVQTMASYRISWAVALVGLALLLCPQDAVSQTASPCPANQGTDNNGCGNTGAGNVGDYNAGSGNKGYCNQAPSIRKLAPAPAPGPGASAKAPGSAPSAAGAPSTVIPSRG
ncbi:hypothetical protein WJX84_003854 [Apatococcus fuscideae]|uniref:Uncharacterized protein n=1 Tax=Apatococcus fuscideae TaxID=2026836 RepID=A0AAW1THT3_9CHLO